MHIQAIGLGSGGIDAGWPLVRFAGIRVTAPDNSIRFWAISGSNSSGIPSYMIAYTFNDDIPGTGSWRSIQVTTLP